MSLFYEDKRFTLLNGDCRLEMRTLGNSSVDSIVTDAPYELGFMGKGWDRSGIAYDVSVWRECLRVLKPGGHLLAFGGSRTYHRLACAIEDAGFEIRDQIQWLYGSGFPKSLDVSKALDRRGGQSVAWFGSWLRSWRTERGITQKEIAALFPSRTGGPTGCVANWELGLNMPTPDQFNLICSTYQLPFDSLEEAEREVIGKIEQGRLAVAPGQGRDRSSVSLDVTVPASDTAKQWNGWGTALKPAHEPIVLARKPLIGSVAENVLQHGTGGLNIDGCRIEMDTEDRASYEDKRRSFESLVGKPTGGWKNVSPSLPVEQQIDNSRLGRWPANVIHDGSNEVLTVFPDAPGQQRSAADDQRTQGAVYGKISTNGTRVHEPREDFGSAARFFYCAKASQEDRNEGCKDLPHRRSDDVHKRPRTELDDPRRHGVTPRQNHHPTVKPADLMRYLCRLVTPPGGVVLDPFCGSGSTGKAAMLEGLRFIGIELSAEYCQLAQLRIEAVTKQGVLFA